MAADTDSLDVNKWIRRAQIDIDAARREAAIFRPPIEVVCYLCQQAAEKIIKAYTIAKTGTRSKDHILKNLLDECVQHSADFDSLRYNCAKLTPYLSVARYPTNIEPTEYDMKQALEHAAKILEFTKAKLKEMGYEYTPEQM